MKVNQYLWLAVALVSLTGCYPMHVQPLPVVNKTEKATVLVYRTSRFTAGAIGVIFGVGASDYYQLSNGSYVEMDLPQGVHSLYLRVPSARGAFRTEVSLKKGELKCFAVKPNAAAVVGGSLGVLGAVVAGANSADVPKGVNTKFFMVSTPCPTKQELEEYVKEEYSNY